MIGCGPRPTTTLCADMPLRQVPRSTILPAYRPAIAPACKADSYNIHRCEHREPVPDMCRPARHACTTKLAIPALASNRQAPPPSHNTAPSRRPWRRNMPRPMTSAARRTRYTGKAEPNWRTNIMQRLAMKTPVSLCIRMVYPKPLTPTRIAVPVTMYYTIPGRYDTERCMQGLGVDRTRATCQAKHAFSPRRARTMRTHVDVPGRRTKPAVCATGRSYALMGAAPVKVVARLSADGGQSPGSHRSGAHTKYRTNWYSKGPGRARTLCDRTCAKQRASGTELKAPSAER